MSPTNFQVGGGYTYQWECSILLALNYFFESVSLNEDLHNLILDFLGQVTEILLEGEDPDSKIDWEDVNLKGGDRQILIQVKTKQAEGERWTLNDPLLLKALYKFYKSNFLKEQPDDTRFVFMTNRPFNPGLVKLKAYIDSGRVRESNEAKILHGYINKYAVNEEIDEGQFYQMLSQTLLVKYYDEKEIKGVIKTKLQALGQHDWETAHSVLFESFSHQSTQMGGSKITPQALREVLRITLGKSGKPNFKRDLAISIGNDQVSGVYEKSLLTDSYGKTVSIDLDKVYRPDALQTKPVDDKYRTSVDPKTTMGELFINEAKGFLLILGQPGAGKTNAILKLCKELLNRAEVNEDELIPVFLNLSSWKPTDDKTSAKSFSDWYEGELGSHNLGNKKYREMLIPLLDGLDEVDENYRESCVEAINKFISKTNRCVVTCRSYEYNNLSTKLNLKLAIEIQRLDDQKVDDYLQKFGGDLTNLHKSLRIDSDDDTQDFIYSPLLLYILVLAYKDAKDEDKKALVDARGNEETFRWKLFATYIENRFLEYENIIKNENKSKQNEPRKTRNRRLRSKNNGQNFERKNIKVWLAWLAYQMGKHSISEFFIEDIQPSFLPYSERKKDLIFGLIFGSIVGLIFGLIAAGYYMPNWSWNSSAEIHYQNIFVPLFWALLFGTFFGQFWPQTDLKPIAKINVSWNIFSLGLALIVTAFLGLLFSIDRSALEGICCGLVVLPIAILVLLNIREIPLDVREGPGQGIKSSLKSCVFVLIFGLIFGLVVGLVFGLMYKQDVKLVEGYPQEWLSFGLFVGLSIWLIIGLFFGMNYGGDFLIKHYITRWFLHRWFLHYKVNFPWDLNPFLEASIDCIFLYRSGGGYSFIHPMLKDHFVKEYDEIFSKKK